MCRLDDVMHCVLATCGIQSGERSSRIAFVMNCMHSIIRTGANDWRHSKWGNKLQIRSDYYWKLHRRRHGTVWIICSVYYRWLIESHSSIDCISVLLMILVTLLCESCFIQTRSINARLIPFIHSLSIRCADTKYDYEIVNNSNPREDHTGKFAIHELESINWNKKSGLVKCRRLKNLDKFTDIENIVMISSKAICRFMRRWVSRDHVCYTIQLIC